MSLKTKLSSIISAFVFLLLCAGAFTVAEADSWSNYTINGSSSEWQATELADQRNGNSLYMTWSSTSLYFGGKHYSVASEDYFVYISTSLLGGTTEALMWNPVVESSHTLSFPMHYCFAFDETNNKKLYRYSIAGSSWSETAYTGEVSTSANTVSIYEFSIPFSDLNITPATPLKILVFTQQENVNNVQNSFPDENPATGSAQQFTYFYRLDSLGSGIASNTIPHNWRISGFSVDTDNSGTHSGQLIGKITPDGDSSADRAYFDFTSAVSGNLTVRIDTNGDGIFDSKDYTVLGNAGSQTNYELQWNGSKIAALGSNEIVSNNTTFYVQIAITDNNSNITVSTNVAPSLPGGYGVLGAWSLSSYATGQVTAGGEPCSGALLSAAKKDGDSYNSNYSYTSYANASGEYELYGLKAGDTYRIVASSDPYASSATGDFTVGGTTGTYAGTAALTWGARVYGTVVDYPAGNPIQDASVYCSPVFSNSSQGLYEHTQSLSDGSYSDQVNPNIYAVGATKSGYGGTYAVKNLGLGTTTQANIVMAKQGILSGYVKYKGTPVTNMYIRLYKSFDDFIQGGYSESSMSTDSSGFYAFTGLRAGMYTVYAVASSTLDIIPNQYHSNIAVYENVVTTPTFDPNTAFELNDGIIISGLVTDYQGQPIEGAKVKLYWTEAGKAWSEMSGETSSSGYYKITHVSTVTASLSILCEREGYSTSRVSPYPMSGSGVLLKNFSLFASTETISGTLTNNTSLASGPFYVYAVPSGQSLPAGSDPEYKTMVYNPSGGAYSLNVSSQYGRYDVGVFASDINSMVAFIVDVASGSANADIVIDSGTYVSGKVTHAITGEGVYNASVEPYYEGLSIGFANTNGLGEYNLGFLPLNISTYTLKVTLYGYATGYLFNVSSGTAGNDIVLQVAPENDSQKPIISRTLPLIEEKIKVPQAEIHATLSDGNGTGINESSIVLKLDGEDCARQYNPVTGEVSFSTSSLYTGMHAVYLICRDSASPAGLEAGGTWYFEVDVTTPTVSLTAHDTNGNGDNNINFSSGEGSMRIVMDASELGDYTLYIDSNSDGAYTSGTDPLIKSGTPNHDVEFTTLVSTTDWEGYIYNESGTSLGIVAAGTWQIRALVDDSPGTGSATDGNYTQASVSVTVDQTNPVPAIVSPETYGTIIAQNNQFTVRYSLSENCYSSNTFNTYLRVANTTYGLYDQSMLTAGEHSLTLSAGMVGANLQDNGNITIELEVYDLAKNRGLLSQGGYATYVPPAPITGFSAAPGAIEGTANLIWSTPGDDYYSGWLNPGEYRIQYSSYAVVWSTSSAQIAISTGNFAAGEMHQRMITGLSGGDTYYFRIWTRDETEFNWSPVSSGATAYAQPNNGAIITADAPADYNLGNRRLVKDSSGILYHVYASSSGGNSHIYIERSINNGLTWGAVTAVENGLHNQINPSIAVDDADRLHVVWAGKDGAGDSMQIRYSSSAAGGAVWSPYSDISSISGYEQDRPVIAIDHRDNLHVVWQGKDSTLNKNEIKYTRRDSGSGAWTYYITVSSQDPADMNNSDPDLVIDRLGGLHMVWTGKDNATQKYNIFYSSKANNAEWMMKVLISFQMLNKFNPAMAVNFNNEVFVAAENDSSKRIVISSRTIGGAWASWADVSNLSVSTETAPSLAVDSNGNFHCAWSVLLEGAQSYQIAYSSYTAVWHTPSVHTMGDFNQSNPAIRWSGWNTNQGPLEMVWSDRRNNTGEADIRYIKLTPAMDGGFLHAPSSVSYVELSSYTYRLSWNTVPEATCYALCDGTGAPYRIVNGAGASWYDEDAGAPNMMFQRSVKAKNEQGYSVISDTFAACTYAYPPEVIASTSVNSSTVNIEWKYKIIANASQYKLYYSTYTYGADSRQYLTTKLSNETTHQHTGLLPGVTYSYFIVPVNQKGVDAEIYAFPLISTRTYPASVAYFSTSAVTDLSLNLEWGTPQGIDGYYMYFSSNSSYERTIPAGTTFWAYTATEGCTPILRKIQAFNTRGLSADAAFATYYTLARVPTTTVFAGVGYSTAAISWNINGNSQYADYEISKSSNYGSYSVLDTSNAAQMLPYNNSGLQENVTYTYRLRARNGNGIYTGYDTAISTCINNAPNSIYNLTALPDSFIDGVVQLRWSNPGDDGSIGNLTGQYLIKCATYYISDTTAFDSISEVQNFSAVRSTNVYNLTPGTSIGFTVTGLYYGSRYFFAVRAKDEVENWSVWPGTAAGLNASSFANSQDSNPSSVNTISCNPASPTTIDLQWTSPSPSENNDFDKYWLYRGTYSFASKSSPNLTISTFVWTPDTTGYTDTGLSATNTYWYMVTLWDKGDAIGAGMGGYAKESSFGTLVSTKPALGKPMAPSNFGVQAVYTSSITWKWSDNSSNEEFFYLKVSSSPNNPVFLSTAAADTTQITEYNLVGNATYYRRVASYNSAGESAVSMSSYTILPARIPENCDVAGWGAYALMVQWTPTNAEGTQYYIYASTADNSHYGFVGQTSGYQWWHTGLNPNTTYYYRVAAYDDTLKTITPQSNETMDHTNATTPAASVISVSSVSVTVGWNENGNSLSTKYYVRVSTYNNGSFGTITETYGNYSMFGGTYTHRGLKPNVTYYYQVEAEGFNNTAQSTDISTHTLAAIPHTMGFTVGVSSIAAYWEANGNSDDTFYELYMSTGTTTDFGLVWSGLHTAAGFVPGLIPNTTYWFKATARNQDNRYTGWSADTSTHTFAQVPGAITFNNTTDNTGVVLSWVDTNPAGTKYLVDAATGTAASYGQIYYGTNIGNITHAGLTANTTYFYRVRAENQEGVLTGYNSALSTHTRTNVPGAITFNNATATSVTLTWADTNSQSARYRLEASTGTNTTYGEVFAGYANTWTHSGLSSNLTYYYRVRGENMETALSGFNTADSTHTLCATPPPPYMVLADTTAVRVDINIANNSNGTKYAIAIDNDKDLTVFNTTNYIQTDGTSGAAPAWRTYAEWATVYALGLSTDSVYHFKTAAMNLDGVISEYSASISTYTVSTKPASPYAGSVAAWAFTVNWSAGDNPSNTSYICDVSTDSAYGVKSSSATSLLSAQFSALNGDTTYFYRVRSVNGLGRLSNYTTVQATSTLAYSPDQLNTAAVGITTMTFTIQAPLNQPYTKYAVAIDTSYFAGNTVFDTTNYLMIGAAGTIRLGEAPVWRTKSEWEADTIIELSTNTKHYFKVMAKNSNDIQTSFSAVTTTSTLATIPGTPAYNIVSSHTMVLYGFMSDNNPLWTNYAVQVDTDGDATSDFSPLQYVWADGTLSNNATWYMRSTFDPKNVINLEVNRIYRYRAFAVNEEGIPTAVGAENGSYTYAAVPPPPVLANSADTYTMVADPSPGVNPTDNGTSNTKFAIAVDDDGDASEDFAPEKYLYMNGTLSAAVTWYTDAEMGAMWMVNLSTNTIYRLKAKARNQSETETLFGGVSTLYTRASVPNLTDIVAVSSNTALVSWGANGNPSHTNYTIEYCQDYPALAPLPGSYITAFSTDNATTGTHFGIRAGTTHYYRVYAVNENGLASTGYSSIVSSMTLPTNPPVATITVSGPNSMTVAPGYGENHPYTTLAVIIDTTTNGVSFDTTGYLQADGTAGPNETWLKDTEWGAKPVINLIPNSIYRYKLRAKDMLGRLSSVYGSENWKYTYAAIPSGTYLDGVGTSSATIHWTANSNPVATEYEIWRSLNNSSYNLLTVLSGTSSVVCSYEDTGLASNTYYYYKVRARNAEGVFTVFDDIRSTVTLAGAPLTPAVTVISSTSISVDITADQNPADTEYAIAIDTDTDATEFNSTGYVQANGAIGLSEAWQTDSAWSARLVSGLQVNKVYRFKAKARNKVSTETWFGSSVSKYTYVNPPVSVSLSVTVSSITVSWNANNNPEGTSFRVHLSSYSGFDSYSSSITALNSAGFAGLAVNTTYFLRMDSYNGDGEDGNWVSLGSKATLCNAPSAAAFSGITPTVIRANWTANSNPSGSAYVAEISTWSGFGGTITSVETTASYYDFASLSPNTTYYFQVKAMNHGAVSSAYVSLGAQMTKPQAPSGLAKSDELDTEVTLTWAGNGIEKFVVDRSVDGGVTWALLQGYDTGLTAATYKDTGLNPETTYYYRVWGYNKAAVLSTEASNTVVKTGLVVMSITEGGTQDSSDGTAVEVPAGAVSEPIRIVIRTDPENQPKEVDADLIKLANDKIDALTEGILGTIREFVAYKRDGTVFNSFEEELVISIPYPDKDGDGYVDNVVPRVSIDALRMYTLNEKNVRWEIVSNSKVNSKNKTVQSLVKHLSVYRLMAPKAAADLTKVIVYPNPFRPGGTGDYALYDASVITFKNLTDTSRIRIFTLAGELVVSFDESSDNIAGDGMATWNARNAAGDKVASGMYMYLVTDDNKNKATGFFGIIR